MAFQYKINPDFDHLIDEKGNMAIYLRKISWNGAEERLDLRKYIINGTEEQMNKGVSFFTEEGPHELVKVLTKEGYGRTKEIIESIKDRDDFQKSLNIVLGKESEFYDDSVKDDEENYYDPKELDLD